MKVYSAANFAILLVLLGGVVLIWFGGNGEVSVVTIIAHLLIASAYAYSSLSEKGYLDFRAHIEMIRKNLSSQANGLAHILYHAPVILILTATLIEVVLPSWKWVVVIILAMALVIHYKVTTLKARERML